MPAHHNGRMAFGVVLLLMALSSCSPPRALDPPPVSPDPALLYAPHYRDGKYFNPWGANPNTFRDFLRWKFSANEYAEAKKQTPQIPLVRNDGSYLQENTAAPSVTWIGHATVLVQDLGDIWLTDPNFSDSIFWMKRFRPPGIPLEKIPTPKFVVISHNHYDHLDEPTIKRLPKETMVLVPKGLKTWMQERGHENSVELDWWESAQVGDWKVTLLPSQHWSRRGFSTDTSLWGSWLMEGHGRKYFFAADTGYFHGFQEFGKKFGSIDVVMMPIGAFAPRWFMQYQHTNPAEALQAFQELKGKFLIPIHWGTFDLADEPLDEPPRLLQRQLEQRPDLKERVRILAIGEQFVIPPSS